MSTESLLVSLLFGSIGLGYFIYGKKQSDLMVKWMGIALMVYPYFVENTLARVIVGVLLMLAPKFIKI
ncbi:MAG: hypothetical protein COW84_03870 [Gammaproteobacteria bacterium CG22_combo_CG10-13_8_21_14_all_40_8]|nr:MAG: hypothetical protein COW84_03870 [Gammaproteobacteria bacterium CG22_combo_CG10-13_8_21_14_all_40_8]